MASTLGRRLIFGMGAYSYAQLVTVATQLLSLPLFLSVWDVATYGNWLIISAIPSYLSLADAGLTTAAANRMIALFEKKQYENANIVFQSAVAFLLTVSAAAMCIATLAVWTTPSGLLHIDRWQPVLMLLILSVLLSLFCSLAESIYKATRGYATGTYLVTSGRLVEWGGGIVGLFAFRSYLAVAIAALVARAIYTLWMLWQSRGRTPHLDWGVRKAQLQVIKSTSRSGLLFLMISLTNALSLQGFTLLVATLLGPIATVTFNAYRTIARVVTQVAGTLSNPLWPELAALHGRGEYNRFRHVYGRASAWGLAIAGFGAFAVFLVSPLTLEMWSKGKIAFDSLLMGLFMFYAAMAAAWQIPRVALLSTDRHSGLAWKGLLISAVALAAAVPFTKIAGIYGAVNAMILGEILIWLACLFEVRRLLKFDVTT